MPQMSNMDWFFLMNYFLLIFFMSIILIYFLMKINLLKINKNLKKENYNLKWY